MLINLLICIGCINSNCSFQIYENCNAIDTVIENVILVKVNPGIYKSGLNCDQKTIDYTYFIGKYEITNKQFFDFLNKAIKQKKVVIKQRQILCYFPGNKSVKSDTFIVKYLDNAIFLNNDNKLALNIKYANHPVISVSWFGATAFCLFYNFELPTAKEWEKAARGNNCFRFPWGNEIDSTYANFFNSNDPYEPGTTPVGFYNGLTVNNFKTKNAISAYGCYDMAGNAWEWTNDKFDQNSSYYYGKGGGFNLHKQAQMQVYYISSFRVKENRPPLDRTHLSDGFRVVKHIK